MSDETLQAAEEFDTSEENTDVEFSEVEQDESSSDSEPETEGGQVETAEKAPEVEEDDPKRFQERINKKHYELMQERREREQLQQELERYRQQQAPQRPAIPAKPEPFDDDYDQKLEQWAKAHREAAEYDAQQKLRGQLEQWQQQQRLQEQQRENAEVQKVYADRASKYGLSGEDVLREAQFVGSFGLGQELAAAILKNEHGPLITRHLANNPADIERLRSDPYSAFAEIKAKAAASIQKPKPNPPDPVEPLKGSGARPDDGLPGVVYE